MTRWHGHEEPDGVARHRPADRARRAGPPDAPRDLAVARHLAPRDRADAVEHQPVPRGPVADVDRQVVEPDRRPVQRRRHARPASGRRASAPAPAPRPRARTGAPSRRRSRSATNASSLESIVSATTPCGPAAIRTGPHGPSTTASTIRRSSAGSTPKWLHAPGRSGRLREPCRAPTSASTRRRSSGGPAGRLGPRGSDGARATNHGASGTGGAEGPRTPTGAAAFVIPWTSDPAAPRGGIEDAAPDLRPGSPRRRRRGGRHRDGLAGAARRRAGLRPAGAGRRSAPTSSSTPRPRARSPPTSRTRWPAATARSSSRRRAGTRTSPGSARCSSSAGAAAVVAPNLSLGAALFLRLAETAAGWYARAGAFEPSIVEWHRRGKADRPSGTARALARRIAAVDPRWAVPEPGTARPATPP